MSKKVTIIGMDSCSHCRNAKDYMQKNKIPYTFIDLENPANHKYRKTVSSVPVICIENSNECVIGFSESKVRSLLNKK